MSNKRKWTTTRKILTSTGLVLGATIIGIGVYAGYLYKRRMMRYSVWRLQSPSNPLLLQRKKGDRIG